MKIKKFAASALGTLMAGATLAFPAAAASIEDLPAPFIEDGEADFSMVVGEAAATDDVVGAIDIAVTMGGLNTIEDTVEVEGVAQWSATNGITLNRPNRNLFLNDKTDGGIGSLVEGDLRILDDQAFDDHDGDEIEVTNEIELGSMEQRFNADKRGQDEIGLYVELKDVEDGELFTFGSYFDDEVNFYELGQDNEEVEIFGQTYEVSDDTEEDGEIVLFGDAETFDVSRTEEVTQTIAGEDATFEVLYVGEESKTATIRVDGDLESVGPSDTVRVSGQDVRVRNIYSFGDGEGIVQFGIGSEEMVLAHEDQIEVDGEDVDATYVTFNTNNNTEIEEIEVSFGAYDRDSRFIEHGGVYEDPVFGVEFHYGGPQPDAAEDPAETLEVEGGDEEATLVMTDDSGDEADIEFLWEGELGNEEGSIATYEGDELELDDYFVLNYDERASMFEVTDVDYDEDDESSEEDHEAETIVEFENVFTGDVIELDEDDFEPTDAGTPDQDHVADFRLNRVSYEVTVDHENNVRVSQEDSDETVVFPNLYSETDAAVTFLETANTEFVANDGEGHDETLTEDLTFRLPSTKSTSDQTYDVTVEVVYDASEEVTGVSLEENEDNVEVGALEYDFSVENVDTSGDDAYFEVQVSTSTDYTSEADTEGALAVVQPEDEEGDEHAFVTEFYWDEDDEETEINEVYGFDDAGFGFEDFEEEDDLEATYSYYGTYAEWDTDDEGELEINFPAHEATVGMAMTDPEGSLDAAAVAEEEPYERIMPIIDPVGALDTEIVDPADQDLVLVGGPVVNTLVDDLMQDGKIEGTETEEDDVFEWKEDTPEIQLIEDAFAEGQTALVVAGWEAEDTRRAAGEVQEMLM